MNSLELSIIAPAFIAGAMILATHVPLGIEVLKRGIIFIDLAIAQIAGLGALVATLFFDEHSQYHLLVVQLCALAFAFLGGLILTWTEKKLPEIQEALIGCLFVFSASTALLLLGENPHGGEHMKDLLAGQILWVSHSQLLIVGGLSLMLLAAWFFTKVRESKIGFYLIFATAVTASVQLVGVYMVFASLIFPALAARNSRCKLFTAYMVGIVGLIAGLILSVSFDFATGPAIVCTLFVIGTILVICFPHALGKEN